MKPVRIIRLYTLSTCPFCKSLKKKLDDLGVEYIHTDVDLLISEKRDAVINEVKRYNPAGTYPTMLLVEVVTDYSEDNLKKVLGL